MGKDRRDLERERTKGLMKLLKLLQGKSLLYVAVVLAALVGIYVISDPSIVTEVIEAF